MLFNSFFVKMLLFVQPNYLIVSLEPNAVTVLSLRPVKEKMLQLVVNRQRTTDATQHVHTKGVATETVAVATETVAVATTTNETQTESPTRVLMSDSAIQIDLLPSTSE